MTTTTNEMTIVLAKPFYKVLCEIYKARNNELFMTRQQIGEALEYSNPQKAIDNIHNRQGDRLDQFSTTLNLRGVEGNRTVTRNTMVYSLRGVMEICRFSRQAKADEFMDFVWDVMETLFRGEAILTPTGEQLPEAAPMLSEPGFNYLFREGVKKGGQIYSLKHENKAIRTELQLIHKDLQALLELHPEAHKQLRFPDKQSKQKPTKPTVTYFDNMETLFNDMKDQYQSFLTSQTINNNNGAVMIKNDMVYRIIEIGENKLHFQVNKLKPASMDVYNITKAEKVITGEDGTAQYKIYFEGGAEPIKFTAIPTRSILSRRI